MRRRRTKKNSVVKQDCRILFPRLRPARIHPRELEVYSVFTHFFLSLSCCRQVVDVCRLFEDLSGHTHGISTEYAYLGTECLQYWSRTMKDGILRVFAT